MEFVQADHESLSLIRSLNFATCVSLMDTAIEFGVRFQSSKMINLLSMWRFQRSDHRTEPFRACHSQNHVFFA